jgi:hypothetical protein
MPRYGEDEAREAVGASRSYSEALRRLGMRPAGGNHKLFKHYVDDVWQIPTAHFDAGASARRSPTKASVPMREVLVECSSYPRGRLKQRLFIEGYKDRRCELCGQDEHWRGHLMSLILDHINGVPNDNRLENLRIVCPNCAATLDTHCGRKNRKEPELRSCARCGQEFTAKFRRQRYCSHTCGCRWDRAKLRGVPCPEARKAERPPYEKLLEEIEATSYWAVGRKYGVSDNAVRKWVRFYERQREREAVEGEAAAARVDRVRVGA